MILLGVSGLSMAFGDKTVLDGITFAVPEGARVGVIGANGAGKTTLFRLIMGQESPAAGTVSLAKGKTVGMLSQMTDLSAVGLSLTDYMEAAFPELLEAEREIAALETSLAVSAEGADPAQTARLSARLETLYSAFARDGGPVFRAKCRSMLTHLGFDPSEQTRRVSTLSGGQQTRLSLARLLAREPDLLLLDEPTNHLDVTTLSWLEDYLAAYGGTVMIISHDRYFLDRACDHILEIERTHSTLYKGNYTVSREKREADEASRERRRREQMKIRARIEANIAFQRRCGQEHNFVTIRSKQKQLDRMEVIEKTVKQRTVHMQFAEQRESAGEVAVAKGLTFSYGPRPLISGLSFLIEKGERVLFLGANGTGKSTLMKLIAGRRAPRGGKLTLGYNVEIAYYDQELEGLDLSKTVFDEVHDAFPSKTDLEIRSALARFLFGPDEIVRTVSTLSGGERARVLLCKLMLKAVNLLILDEPTNHLDIGSREALEEALYEFEGTVIAVSHDRYFIDRVATRIIELDPAAEGGKLDCLLTEGEGAYTAYLAMVEQRRAATEAAAPAAAVAPSEGRESYEAQKRERAAARSEGRRRERAALRATELEEELTRLDEELNTSAATDYVRAAAIVRRKEEAEEELLSLYELLEG